MYVISIPSGTIKRKRERRERRKKERISIPSGTIKSLRGMTSHSG